MKAVPGLKIALFKERLNRFAARVQVDGKEAVAHVPNSGRLRELFVPDAEVYVSPAPSPHRKTAFDLRLVRIDDVLVSCDARLPPTLVAEAHALGRLPQFQGYPTIQKEVTFEESRLDLCFSGPGGRVYVETKSVTLVCNDAALFPDSPTTRGAKHLRTLMKAVEQGHGAAVIFVIQRPDAQSFSPFRSADPDFAATLDEVANMGVAVYAYGCRINMDEITLDARVPVELG